jgi:ABC-type antimicrobial peptide transport system permease subunit
MKENERAMKQGSRQPGMGGDASSQGYQNAWVKVKNINDIEKIQKEINEMGFGAHSLSDIRNQMKKQLFIVQAVLGAIGAISLLVAALGITNTMYMSIYERTREIGIIKVLGCYLSDVRKIFLLESGMIGFIGGVSGILLSFLLSTLLNIIIPGYMNAGQPSPMEEESKMVLSVIPLWLSVFAVSFAVFVGLISGYFPSRRAMRLSALDAIKNE